MKAFLKRVLSYRLYSPMQDALRYALSLRYRGDRFACPFCGGQFSNFLPCGLDLPIFRDLHVIGAGYRPNCVCPRCYSEDRERLTYLYLQNQASSVFTESVSLLHVAPERNLSRALGKLPNLRYVTADLGSPLADVQMDITNIELPDETFNVIICNHVLEHIPDDAKAMRELFRIVKRGGFGVFQVPLAVSNRCTVEDPFLMDPEERIARFGQKDHVRIYGQDYGRRLEAAGFTVEQRLPQTFLSVDQVRAYGLLEDEALFVCSKLA